VKRNKPSETVLTPINKRKESIKTYKEEKATRLRDVNRELTNPYFYTTVNIQSLFISYEKRICNNDKRGVESQNQKRLTM